MENYVSDQLVTFFRSALLGMMAGVAYDLLRAVRLRRRRSRALTHTLDAVYVLSALTVLFSFVLREGQGELRLYMLLAMVLGFSFYFLLFSAIFRPLWWFWVDVLVSLLKILWAPAGFLLSCGKNFQIYIKKLFYFWRKYATIYK